MKRQNLKVLRVGLAIVAATEGKEKRMQATEVITVRNLIGKMRSHFITTLVTHQKVATLEEKK